MLVVPRERIVTAAAPERRRTSVSACATPDAADLLASVSHELGSLLTVVRSNVGLVRRSLERRGDWPGEFDQSGDDIEFAIERMFLLREHLIAATRNERPRFDLEPIHLHRCLQRACRWARTAARDRDIELTETYAAANPFAVANEAAVHSIASNLLSNAVRYTRPGGRVWLRTYDDGPNVTFEVADTGIGIAEPDARHIFDRFYRAADARQMTAGGMGLGLAITHDFVTALDGTIEVRSERGAGSTFMVTLPAVTMPANR